MLDVDDLVGGAVHGVSFSLRHGEVLGIAGPLGSGRSHLLKMLFGAAPVRSGTIAVDGIPARFAHIGDAMRAGIGYVPEDRDEAAFLELSLGENLSAAVVGSYWRHLRLDRGREHRDARASMEEFSIDAASERQQMATLSGGNQQKVVVARWLRRNPKVLLLDEPTHGVDVRAPPRPLRVHRGDRGRRLRGRDRFGRIRGAGARVRPCARDGAGSRRGRARATRDHAGSAHRDRVRRAVCPSHEARRMNPVR